MFGVSFEQDERARWIKLYCGPFELWDLVCCGTKVIFDLRRSGILQATVHISFPCKGGAPLQYFAARSAHDLYLGADDIGSKLKSQSGKVRTVLFCRERFSDAAWV